MHCLLPTDNGMTIMESDAPNSMEYGPGNDFSISPSGDDEAVSPKGALRAALNCATMRHSKPDYSAPSCSLSAPGPAGGGVLSAP